MTGAPALTGDPAVLKLGGELLEPDAAPAVIAGIAALARQVPLVVVHGGGREIDAEAARRGLATRSVDGLRITDAATLEAVVAVLAGTVNTRVVAALASRGVPAVGLTGADAGCVTATRAGAYTAADGRTVDLGEVGEPDGGGPPQLLVDLVAHGYVPVLATIGLGPQGTLLNVNADTLAADVAARLGASRLIVAGGVPGVLDPTGAVVPEIDEAASEALVASGTASAGMVAKLLACRRACAAGVRDVRIVDGRRAGWLDPAGGTRVRTETTAAHGSQGR